jgi:hypothetical protein
MALDFGSVTFYNARASGTRIQELGSGQFDHLGFFGPNGVTSAIEVNSYNDTTVIVDDNGDTFSDIDFGGSGYCTNNKNVGANLVQISGLPEGPLVEFITDVNVFDPASLDTEPFFARIPSGTLLIRYDASGVSAVNTFNAKLYAYDATGAITDPAPDVTVVGFEINASGIWKDANHSGVWKSMEGRDNALEFANHSSANGYQPSNVHIWVASVSARADSVGALDDFNFAFQLQFA